MQMLKLYFKIIKAEGRVWFLTMMQVINLWRNVDVHMKINPWITVIKNAAKPSDACPKTEKDKDP